MRTMKEQGSFHAITHNLPMTVLPDIGSLFVIENCGILPDQLFWESSTHGIDYSCLTLPKMELGEGEVTAGFCVAGITRNQGVLHMQGVWQSFPTDALFQAIIQIAT